MEEKRMVMIAVGAVLVIMTISLLAVTQSATSDTEGDGGDGGTDSGVNKTNPLLLISLDGFRSDYIYRDLPTLETLARNGVRAKFLMPSYPTLTFPNHYTIVTGLYPEDHGIVANSFYDPDFGQNFSMSETDGKWWGGEPIWNTLTLENKTSATYFWPGSDREINGLYPTYYYEYNKDTPYEERIAQVVEWLSLPEEERPDLVTLYFEQPDSTGHEKGPDSPELDSELHRMDGVINSLLYKLRTQEMEDMVNIIVLADHGMARMTVENVINITDYVPNFSSLSSHSYYGPFTTLRLENSTEAAVNNVLTSLACPATAPAMRAYVPKDLPRRFHYSKNKRIGDIVLDLDSGYSTYDLDHPEYSNNPYLGNHGYDNHLSTMGALFIATGPDFKKDVELEPFKNIELYNLMCYLTGVEPAPNNGTEGALYAALLDPPDVPELPEEVPPPAATFPNADPTNDTLSMAECPGDLNENDDLAWLQEELDLNKSMRTELEKLHLPWGIPLFGNLSDNLLLHHKDHITGYSEKLMMPLWTSFTITQPLGSEVNSKLWNSDVRLNDVNTPFCSSYADLNVDGKDITMFPLFHPVFSTNPGASRVPYLVSNAVPLVTSSKTEGTLDLLAKAWRQDSAPYNLAIGLAFDHDADSLPDNITDVGDPEIPSHFFIVATYCTQLVHSLDQCNHQDLDAQAFILPQFQTVDNDCLTGLDYASFHLSTVSDVESLTGLTFFPALPPEVRLQLALRIHTHVRFIST